MAKGTPSMGKKSGKRLHFYCRRCGKRSYHMKTGICSSCGYGNSAKRRKFAWKAQRKK
ncbi:50S ribosomal protein L37e [Candidatus Woesearchaeota archaeon]|nr:50S ribosomal protein L37e [Candidatus Woesearchaeota archaeon]